MIKVKIAALLILGVLAFVICFNENSPLWLQTICAIIALASEIMVFVLGVMWL